MGVDLNLLRPLRALLEQRSVTRAAEQLHVSQPTMSAALSRLRQHFGDDLLRREGNSYVLTPLAQQLLERSSSAARSLDRVFAALADFEPATSTREFLIVGSDYSMVTLGAPLSITLQRSAPHVRVRFEQVSSAIVNSAPESLLDYDGLLHPHGYLSGEVRHIDLFSDRWVCVVAPTNERVGSSLTARNLAELPWAMSFGSPTELTPPAKQMQLLGIEPRVEVALPSFLAIPSLLAGTSRIAFLQERHARAQEERGLVRVLECPFDVVPFIETFWWSRAVDRDPEHQWLRGKLREAVALL